MDYRKLLENPREELESLCRYLELSFEEGMLENLPKTKPTGKMGDKMGTSVYDHLTTETLNKWVRMAETFVHNYYLQHYINSLEPEVISGFGFQKKQLIDELQQVKIKRLGNLKEWYFWVRGIISIRFKLNLLLTRKKQKVYYS
jgi:hypothetical protein